MAGPTTAWQRVVAWTSENTAGALAVLTALGFVVGSGVVWAYASGLGVAVADLNLGVQDRVAVAAGILLLPGLALMIWKAPLARLGRAYVFALDALRSFVVAAAMWWTGFGIAAAGVFFLGTFIGGLFVEVPRAVRGRPSFESERTDHWKIQTVVVFTLCTSALFLAWTANAAGRNIRSGNESSLGPPRVVSLVLPATRGVVVIDEAQACVDRVGQHVLMADRDRVVVPSWDAFVPEDCERSKSVRPLLD